MASRFDNNRLGKMLDVFMLAHESEVARLSNLLAASDKNYDETLIILGKLCDIEGIRALIPAEVEAQMRPYIHLDDY